MILLSGKLFFNSYTIRVAIKDKRVLTGKLQIGIGETIYTQRLSFISSYAKNASAITFPNLKK